MVGKGQALHTACKSGPQEEHDCDLEDTVSWGAAAAPVQALPAAAAAAAAVARMLGKRKEVPLQRTAVAAVAVGVEAVRRTQQRGEEEWDMLLGPLQRAAPTEASRCNSCHDHPATSARSSADGGAVPRSAQWWDDAADC